jgi:hypothetical protein
MKIIKQTIYRQQKHEIERKVTDVIHDLPTWMFPCDLFRRDERMLCPVCHREMRMQIGHGEYIETCSMIQVGCDAYPIHKKCYDKLEESHEKL